ncbi:vacuolar protein sorting-associated protein 45 [Bonamia ostreae]|uniref:Vacuolar protein sorting-associated protein 45 n=1 Tax=Bonamia ostreae TaxID=126728 RepID=A0ABV2AUT1_9EUKA
MTFNFKPPKKISKMIKSEKYAKEDILRLCMIFALRFNTASKETKMLKNLLKQNEYKNKFNIEKLQNFCSREGTQIVDLFSKGFIKKSFNVLQNAIKGVENIYTQHSPAINQILDHLVNNRLDEKNFPFLGKRKNAVGNNILIYVVGGCTYEESMCCNRFENQKVVFGSSTILNSNMFVRSLSKI